MSFIPPAQTTEMLSSTVNKSKPIGDEDNQITVSETTGDKEACLDAVIASYAKSLTQDKMHFLGSFL